MRTMDNRFTQQDISVLMDAVGDWERVGNQDFYILNMIRNMPMPPEDHEAYEPIQHLKEHYENRAKEIKDAQEVRRKRAVLLSAKLILIEEEIETQQFLDVASEVLISEEKPTPSSKKVPSSDEEVLRKNYEFAIAFIKDCGIFEHFQKFLAEKSQIL